MTFITTMSSDATMTAPSDRFMGYDDEMSTPEMRAVIMRLTHKLMVAKATICQLQMQLHHASAVQQNESKLASIEAGLRRDLDNKDKELSQLRRTNDEELQKIADQVAKVEVELRQEKQEIEREMQRKDKIIQGQRKIIKRLLSDSHKICQGAPPAKQKSLATLANNNKNAENIVKEKPDVVRHAIRDSTNILRTAVCTNQNNYKNAKELPCINEEDQYESGGFCKESSLAKKSKELLRNRFIRNNRSMSKPSRVVSTIIENNVPKIY